MLSYPVARLAPPRCVRLASSAPCDVVVVHDAARPLASFDLFVAVVAAVESGADAAIPGLVSPTRSNGRVARWTLRRGRHG